APAWCIIMAVQHIVGLLHQGIHPVFYLGALLILREHPHVVEIRKDLEKVRLIEEYSPDMLSRCCNSKRGPQAREPIRTFDRLDYHITRKECSPITAGCRGNRNEEHPQHQEGHTHCTPRPPHRSPFPQCYAPGFATRSTLQSVP